jgi:hypothetical protein
VAVLPVNALALDTAVVDHLARRADLVLQREALRTLAGIAVNLTVDFSLSLLLDRLRILPGVRMPLGRSKVRPGVNVRD